MRSTTQARGPYATTDKEYGDFELTLEYNMAPKGDSGVYLRGAPQVQIWDPTDEKAHKHGAQLGSGALWNNSPGKPGKDPLVLADKPAGEWNTLRVVMVGARVSVWLNGKQTVDHATIENYYDRKAALAAKGPICLQTHGAPIRWRNVAIREIAGEEASRILSAKAAAGYKSIFNGKDFTGWAGPVENYEVVDGAIRCKTGKGGTPYYDQDLTDFAVRLEFKLPKGGNNGLALRYPGTGNTAYVGMCELQVLDDNYDKVKGKIDPRQVHGSAYGMVGAQRGFQRPDRRMELPGSHGRRLHAQGRAQRLRHPRDRSRQGRHDHGHGEEPPPGQGPQERLLRLRRPQRPGRVPEHRDQGPGRQVRPSGRLLQNPSFEGFFVKCPLP